jgi:SAM-dependent methyltransferase
MVAWMAAGEDVGTRRPEAAVRGMSPAATGDAETLNRHRQIWRRRPELQAVYQEWFEAVLVSAGLHSPVVEIGAGPGFLKEYCPSIVATDIVASPWIDAVCDARQLPFPSGAVGALVMIDVLHHLSAPLEFMREASRVLRPGARLVALEPWVTPLSFLLYRYFHHEDCRLRVDVSRPFGAGTKNAFDGNAAIPLLLARQHADGLTLVEARPFVGLPYLTTLGFKYARPMPRFCLAVARLCEPLVGPFRSLAATRSLLVWQKP